MPLEESTPAIVLRSRDYGESDRIVTLLTRDHGKLGGIAKGAKNSRHRFERKLEPFSHVMLHFRRRHGQLVFITRAEAIDLVQFRIDDDLGKFALGSYVLELTDALTREEAEAADAYRLLALTLETLSNRGADLALRQAFELKLLEWAGYGLEFSRCRDCAEVTSGGSAAAYFVVGRGGVVCPRCRTSVVDGAIRLEAPSVASLARLSAMSLEDALGAAPGGIDASTAIARFMSSVLDRRLRSAEFLDTMLPPK